VKVILIFLFTHAISRCVRDDLLYMCSRDETDIPTDMSYFMHK